MCSRNKLIQKVGNFPQLFPYQKFIKTDGVVGNQSVTKDRLIRERACNGYRGRAATPNLRDFFENYEGNAAQNSRDTSHANKTNR